jgi:predicted transcriptional regulator
MSDIDNIPDTFLNKSQISVKYGMSRVTINKHLKALEASGRLIPTIVKQGNRKLYKYDPADLDVAFASLNSTSKNNKNVQSIVFNDQNVKLQNENELLKINIQNAEKRLLEKDEQISDLKDQRDLKDRQIEVLQSLVTDQRPKSSSISPEPTKEEVVPPKIEPEEPKPATVAEIKEAVADADKSDVGLINAEPEEQPESPPVIDTQPTSEAPTDTGKEARRDNIAPKPEPKQYEKPKGFWAWIKGY